MNRTKRKFAVAALLSIITLLLPTAALGSLMPGDLDGDGTVDLSDDTHMMAMLNSEVGDGRYDPAGDLNEDGRVDTRDLSIFGTLYGLSGGEVDDAPPSLFVTLNDIPDDMNDLLVVPPDGFKVTLSYDRGDGALLALDSLSVTSDVAVGGIQAGEELSHLFSVSREGAVWEVAGGTSLDRASHHLTVSIADTSGNTASDSYGFAVRDFQGVAPLAGAPQIVYLDFTSSRSGGLEPDLIEDMRLYGLSSPTYPDIEAAMYDWVVEQIVRRTRLFYGLQADGSPGSNSLNVAFTTVDPGPGQRTRLCVGGASIQGTLYLGLTQLDQNNAAKFEDTCPDATSFYGVFPSAIRELWGTDPTFLETFVDQAPYLGGRPVGEGWMDLDVFLDPLGFDPNNSYPHAVARFLRVAREVTRFSQVVATAIAHETGHLLGLVAHGPTPSGLCGGSVGANADHNETASGGTPAENYLMNAGGSFSFMEMSAANSLAPPVFRRLSLAYLENRLVLDSAVSGLYPAPIISHITPNPAEPAPSATITIHGGNFRSPVAPWISLSGGGSPIALQSPTFVDADTITGTVSFFVPAGTYDVDVISGDGQIASTSDALTIE